MNNMIRTAFSRDMNAEAAIRACRHQLNMDGPGQSGPYMAAPDLLVIFAAGKQQPEAVLAAVKLVFGDVPLAGGAAAGVISQNGNGYSGFEIGIIAFKGEAVTPQVLSTRGLLGGAAEASQALGQAVRARTENGAVVLLLFDSVAQAIPLRLHPASEIVAGFHEGLGDRELQLLGGGLLSDINLSGAWVFDEGEVCKHALTALVFPPGVHASTEILHGCRPVSTFMEVTRIEGAEVFELDGRPALTVIEQMLGLELGTTSGQQLSLVATLGQKQGDPFAPYNENNYVNRMILQATPDRGSVTLFDSDFARGTRVQIMSRDNLLMMESVERGVAAMRDRIAGKTCLLGLYIDCAGRASVMSGAETEEAELVLRGLAPEYPFMGFYSGVEIAPFAGNYSRPLDWTGVLTILHRRE